MSRIEVEYQLQVDEIESKFRKQVSDEPGKNQNIESQIDCKLCYDAHETIGIEKHA